MKINKFVFYLPLLVIILSSCRLNKPSVIQKNNKIRVGVAIYKQDDKFLSNIVNGFDKLAKEKETRDNCDISIDIVDAKGNQNIQNEQIDKFISQKYDVICVNLVDRTVASNVIDKAKAANIPIVFFNREPVEEDLERWDKVYYVGADAIDSGIMEGRIIVDEYLKNPEKVDKNGDGKIQYVMLEGEQGHQDALIRTDFCIKTVKNAGIEVEKLANDTANWQRAQGAEKMSKWLQKYGNQIEVVFSNNDDMALGAIDKIYSEEFEDKDIIPPLVVGVDGIPEAFDAIESGKMIGTVENDYNIQSKTIFNLAYCLAKNEDPKTLFEFENDKYIRIPYKSVIQENVKDFKKKHSKDI